MVDIPRFFRRISQCAEQVTRDAGSLSVTGLYSSAKVRYVPRCDAPKVRKTYRLFKDLRKHKWMNHSIIYVQIV
jgi:hypothetical protein